MARCLLLTGRTETGIRITSVKQKPEFVSVKPIKANIHPNAVLERGARRGPCGRRPSIGCCRSAGGSSRQNQGWEHHPGHLLQPHPRQRVDRFCLPFPPGTIEVGKVCRSRGRGQRQLCAATRISPLSLRDRPPPRPPTMLCFSFALFFHVSTSSY